MKSNSWSVVRGVSFVCFGIEGRFALRQDSSTCTSFPCSDSSYLSLSKNIEVCYSPLWQHASCSADYLDADVCVVRCQAACTIYWFGLSTVQCTTDHTYGEILSYLAIYKTLCQASQ